MDFSRSTHDIWTISGVYQHLVEGVCLAAIGTGVGGSCCGRCLCADHTRWRVVVILRVIRGAAALDLVLISVIHPGQPREQDDASVAEYTVQEQLTAFVFIEYGLEFAHFS